MFAHSTKCGAGISLRYVALLILMMGIPASLFPATIRSIKWQKNDDSFDFLVLLSNPVPFTTSDQLAEKGYLTVELRGINSNYGSNWLQVGDDLLQRVKVDSHQDRLRFVFYPPIMIHSAAGYDSSQSSLLRVRMRPSVKKLSDCKIIIIDPGHGGKSRGARSAYPINGSYVWEKDIVLQMANKLKRLIDRSPNLVAYLTRTDDSYKSLSERVEFAQTCKGDLFVSIHCNAVEEFKPTSARGIEFFCWNERGSALEAVRFLERIENDEGIVLNGKGANGHLKQILTNLIKEELGERQVESRDFCKILNTSFSRDNYFQTYNRGIKEARFKVLANYMMPSVLVETGFISNTNEAKLLIDDSFQWRICRSIFDSISKYFSYEYLAAAGE